MKAVYYSQEHKLLYGDLPEPKAGTGQVVVRVQYVGICGSDLHLFKSRRLPDQTVMGHEVSGAIEVLGEGVTERRIGQRVIIRPMGCGVCHACRDKKEHLCSNRRAIGLGQFAGGYAEKAAVPWSMTIPVPDSVSLAHASLTDPLATALHAIRLAQPMRNKPALILGAGAIGLSCLALLKREGAHPVLISEPEPARKEMALRLGADLAFHPKDPDIQEAIHSLTRGLGPAAVFECSGIPEAFHQAMIWIAKGGDLVLVGLGSQSFSLPPLLSILKEIHVTGSFANTQEECREILERMSRRDLSVESITRDRISLAELPRVFEELLAGSPRIKVLVEVKAEDPPPLL